MKFLRRRTTRGDPKSTENNQINQINNNNSTQMGQFSSSEVQAASAVATKAVVLSSGSSAAAVTAAAVIHAENATEVRCASAKQQDRAHSLASASSFRPSQPIDIRGQHTRLRSEAALAQYRPLPNPLQEETKTEQHQPRVVQPRRLTGTSPSASLGPIRGGGHGRNDLNIYRERVWQETMRRRLLSLDSRPLDPECPGSSGENNKENATRRRGGDQQQPEAMATTLLEESSKKLSRSRKRLNSEAREDSSEPEEKEPIGQKVERNVANTLATSPDRQPHQQHQAVQTTAGRRVGGRIAYLYGVYGQEHQPPSTCGQQLLYSQQMGAGVEPASAWTNCWEKPMPAKDQLHFCTSDCEEDCLEMDAELLDRDEPAAGLARLHTVSDIIGYAKVVRAQRQETLGRLNDVMSQFDALIRSYSMSMKTSGQQAKQAEAEEMTRSDLEVELPTMMMDDAPMMAQQQQLQQQKQQPKAVTN